MKKSIDYVPLLGLLIHMGYDILNIWLFNGYQILPSRMKEDNFLVYHSICWVVIITIISLTNKL